MTAEKTYRAHFDPNEGFYRDSDNSFDIPHRDFDNLATVYESVHEVFVEDPIVLEAIRLLESRSQQGMVTYGTSLMDNPGNVNFWIDNAIQEALDLVNYLLKLKSTLNVAK